METSGSTPRSGDLLAHAAFLRRVARGMLLDAPAADDVVQEAVLAGLRREAEPGAGWRPWLAGVVKNLARMRHRGEARRAARERGALLARAAESPAAIVERLEIQRRLVAAVLALPEASRAVVVRHFFDGLSLAEIARREGVPAATVRARLKRGLDALRDRFDDEHDGDRRAWIAALLPLALARPPATGVAGAAAATLAVLGGELIMKPVVVAAAGLLVAILTAVTLFSPDTAEPPATPGKTVAAAPAAPDADATAEAASASAEDLPATYDLASADRDHDLFGTVTAPDGAAIPGAEVNVARRPWSDVTTLGPFSLDVLMHEEPGPSCRSARDGTFRLRLRRGESVDLRISADGFQTARYPGRLAGERVDAVLDPAGSGARLIVTVTDEHGDPVTGATARARQGGGDAFVDRSATTDEEGVAVVTGLAPGGGGVAVEAPGRMPGLGPFHVGREGTARIRFVLDRGIEIRGTVRDAETGEPIAGAEILDPVQNAPARTGPDGTFRLPVAIETPEPMYARAPGYAGATVMYPGHGPLDFRLPRGVRAVGRIVDGEGRPIAGALVAGLRGFVPGLATPPTPENRSTFSDAEGGFVLDGLSSGRPYLLLVRAPGHARVERDAGIAPAAGETWGLGDLVLATGRRIEGRVEDPAGGAVRGLSVRLESLTPVLVAGRADAVWPMSTQVRTDDLGRFRFVDLPPGRYRLRATSAAGAMPAQTEAEVPADFDPPEVRMILSEGPTLVVRIVDPEGRPVPGTTLLVASDTGFGTSARTGEDGAASITGIPRDAVDVRIDVRAPAPTDGPRYADTLWDVGTTVGEVTIPLRSLARVTGRALTSDGAPVPNTRVRVTAGPGEELVGSGSETDADGRFELWLATGQDATLQLLSCGEPAGYGELRGVRAPAEGLVLEVRRFDTAASVPVRVTGPDGEPVPGAVVSVDFCGRRIVSGQRLDAEGAARLAGVPDWIVWVEVTPPPGWAGADAAAKQLFVADARKGRIDLRLRRPVRCEGRIVLPDGAPAPGARVATTGIAFDTRTAIADRDGRFALVVYPDDGERLVATYRDAQGRGYRGEAAPAAGEIRLTPTSR